jgi:hypothetical protein
MDFLLTRNFSFIVNKNWDRLHHSIHIPIIRLLLGFPISLQERLIIIKPVPGLFLIFASYPEINPYIPGLSHLLHFLALPWMISPLPCGRCLNFQIGFRTMLSLPSILVSFPPGFTTWNRKNDRGDSRNRIVALEARESSLSWWWIWFCLSARTINSCGFEQRQSDEKVA